MIEMLALTISISGAISSNLSDASRIERRLVNNYRLEADYNCDLIRNYSKKSTRKHASTVYFSGTSIRNYFVNKISVDGISRTTLVDFNSEHTYSLSQAGRLRINDDGRELGTHEIKSSEELSTDFVDFMKKNNYDCIIGRNVLKSFDLKFDVISGEVSFFQVNRKKSAEIPGKYDENGYQIDLTKFDIGKQYLLSKPSSVSRQTASSISLGEVSSGQSYYCDVDKSEVRVFAENSTAVDYQRGLLSFNRRFVWVGPEGIRLQGEGFFGPFARLMLFWLDKPDEQGSRVSSIIGYRPKELLPGDIVQKIDGIDLRKGDAGQLLFGEIASLLQTPIWHLQILRKGKVISVDVDRLDGIVEGDD